ncbi:MAG: antibiotic biosynthesis monooxygenase [Victivallales bacterium]|jgi:quinol monooxygenase YgiN|nr:antibiotic biosynthesis monooxygenase [Victivallales bacterium]
MINVIASIEVKPEYLAEFIKAFKANVPAVLAENGCIAYAPTVDVDTGLPPQGGVRANVVTIVEAWESLDHLRAHLVAPHMKSYKEATKDMTVGVSLMVTEPV